VMLINMFDDVMVGDMSIGEVLRMQVAEFGWCPGCAVHSIWPDDSTVRPRQTPRHPH